MSKPNPPHVLCLKERQKRLKDLGIESDDETPYAKILPDLLEKVEEVRRECGVRLEILRNRAIAAEVLAEGRLNRIMRQDRRIADLEQQRKELGDRVVELASENSALEKDLCREGKRRVLYQDSVYRAMNHVDAALGRSIAKGSTLETFDEDVRDALLRQERKDEDG